MAIVALRWFKAALVLQVLLIFYWLAKEVLNLFPWNDLAAQPADGLRNSVALNALPLLGLMAVFALGIRPLAMLSVFGYALYFVVQVWVWWKPFVIGADEAWEARYFQLFGRTMKIMPPTDTYLPPDSQHITVQLLALVTVVVTGVAVARMNYL